MDILSFALGTMFGLLISILFLVCVSKTSKKPKEDPDDWWKRGEPAPWEKEDEDE